jgi:hypothetical protein
LRYDIGGARGIVNKKGALEAPLFALESWTENFPPISYSE